MLQQRATLDKLAGEYADELANLGVRVSNLEKKVGNLHGPAMVVCVTRTRTQAPLISGTAVSA